MKKYNEFLLFPAFVVPFLLLFWFRLFDLSFYFFYFILIFPILLFNLCEKKKRLFYFILFYFILIFFLTRGLSDKSINTLPFG